MEENITDPTWKKLLTNSLILMSFITASWELAKLFLVKEKTNTSFEIVYEKGVISKISGDDNQTKISYVKNQQDSTLNFDPCNKVDSKNIKGN